MSAKDRSLRLFEAAVELTPAERAAFLARECDGATTRRDVESLLAADARTARLDLERPALGTGFHVLAASAPLPVTSFPAAAGRYTILAELGAGGHGVVYRASQERPRREVALKLLRLRGPSTRERVLAEAEAETLARLTHPGIAQVYDTGVLVVEGAEFPFVAMELVTGRPLLQWCKETSPALPTRVRLLIDVCEATEAAHQRGVIHCDLKPDNILVDDDGERPRPRILDFGVARIVGADRPVDDPRALVGTLAYMSPEQATRTDIDTRADVFALGSVAYELLCGVRARDVQNATTAEVTHRIGSERPVPLSQHDHRLAGDLERIVACAMANDRDARYASAGALANDLRRYLDHRPIAARPQDPWYLLACFARRRKSACVAIAVVTVSLITASIVGWLSFAQANAALDRLIATSQFTVAEVVGRLESLSGTTAIRAAALQRLLPQVEELLVLRPHDPTALTCRATILRHMSALAHRSEDWSQSLELRTRALADSEFLRAAAPGDPGRRAQRATDLVLVGDVHKELNGPAAARPMHAEAHATFLDLARRHPDEARHLDDLAWSHHRLAYLDIEASDFAGAEAHLDEHATLLDRLQLARPGNPFDLSGRRSLHSLWSHLERRRGNLDACCEHLRLSILPARARLQIQPHDVGAVLEFAGSVTTYLNDTPKARTDPESASLRQEARQAVERLLAYDPGSYSARVTLRNLNLAEGTSDERR